MVVCSLLPPHTVPYRHVVVSIQTEHAFYHVISEQLQGNKWYQNGANITVKI